jgi:hypothetical protein
VGSLAAHVATHEVVARAAFVNNTLILAVGECVVIP